MTDFVLEHPASTDYEWQLSNHLRYANFLKQTKQLWMFVPCDEDGNILEEPDLIDERYNLKLLNYEQAKEKVLFEGFEYFKSEKHGFLIKNKKTNYIVFFHTKGKQTLELLQYANLELTETGFKYFYGC